jgi:hypothetical protein
MRGSRALWMAASLAASACEPASSFAVRIGFASASLGTRAERVLVAVREGGCASATDADWSAALATAELARGVPSARIGPVRSGGRLAVVAVAIDPACHVIAASCTDTAIPGGGEELVLTLEPLAAPFCAADLGACAVRCEGGGPDGGERDAAGVDGSTVPQDAAIDAGEIDGCSAPTYAEAVLADRPVLYWRLDETVGPYADRGGVAELAGELEGEVERGVAGAIAGDGDRAVGFASAGSVVNVAVVERYASAESASFELWCYWRTLPAIGAHSSLINAETYPSTGFRLDFTFQGYPSVLLWPGPSPVEVRSSRPMPELVWSHVVLVLRPDGTDLHVNGALTASSTEVLADRSADALAIGRFHGTGVDALIDEVAVYAHALDPDRIRAHFALGRDGPRCR